jgi:hypothetical protein
MAARAATTRAATLLRQLRPMSAAAAAAEPVVLSSKHKGLRVATLNRPKVRLLACTQPTFFSMNCIWERVVTSAQVLWHTSLPTATTTTPTLVLSKRKMLERVKGKGSGARRARGKRRSLIKPRHSNHALRRITQSHLCVCVNAQAFGRHDGRRPTSRALAIHLHCIVVWFGRLVPLRCAVTSPTM